MIVPSPHPDDLTGGVGQMSQPPTTIDRSLSDARTLALQYERIATANGNVAAQDSWRMVVESIDHAREIAAAARKAWGL